MLCFSVSELQSGFGASEISAALGLHVNFLPIRSRSRIFRQLLAVVCFFFPPSQLIICVYTAISPIIPMDSLKSERSEGKETGFYGRNMEKILLTQYLLLGPACGCLRAGFGVAPLAAAVWDRDLPLSGL